VSGPGGAAGRLRLGVNIDHVATIRNARGGDHPDPARAAEIAAAAGADGITFHLREDRRHIRDEDLAAIAGVVALPLNLEMAATEEMLEIALRSRPHAVCLVPERREERTTEGGLDAAGKHNEIAYLIRRLNDARIRVSLFIEPDPVQIEAAVSLGAPVVELHTGAYCEAALTGDAARLAATLDALRAGATHAAKLGLEPHAGHGLTYESVGPVAAIPDLAELNIGHFLIGEAIFVGLDAAIREMRARMDAARAGV
jgi:pyridoxine 5-phosphate synthase